MNLKPYMCFERDMCYECAILVFAHTARQARMLAYPWLSEFNGYCEWTDARAKLMRNADYIFEQADQAKLAAGEPHVISNPKSCPACEHWGMPLNENGICENCADEIKWNMPGESPCGVARKEEIAI